MLNLFFPDKVLLFVPLVFFVSIKKFLHGILLLVFDRKLTFLLMSPSVQNFHNNKFSSPAFHILLKFLPSKQQQIVNFLFSSNEKPFPEPTAILLALVESPVPDFSQASLLLLYELKKNLFPHIFEKFLVTSFALALLPFF